MGKGGRFRVLWVEVPLVYCDICYGTYGKRKTALGTSLSLSLSFSSIFSLSFFCGRDGVLSGIFKCEMVHKLRFLQSRHVMSSRIIVLHVTEFEILKRPPSRIQSSTSPSRSPQREASAARPHRDMWQWS